MRFAPPPPSIPTPLPFMLNCPPTCLAHPPESVHLDALFLLTIANASQLANHIVSQHTTAHPVLSTRPGLVFAYVCLPALSCPCAFFGRDLLACMGHLIFYFLCKHTSAALRHVCSCARMCVWVWVRPCVCKIQLQDRTRSLTQGRPTQ